MTQIPRDRAVGSEEPGPTALTSADILNALTLGACLTLQVSLADSETTAESCGTVLLPPLSSSQPPPSSTGARQPASTPAVQESSGAVPTANNAVASPSMPSLAAGIGAVQVPAGGGVLVGSIPIPDTGALKGGSTSTGKAKAATENGPCAECAARGCLPPPTPNEDEAVNQVADDTSTRWYVVTAGRHVGVFPHWSSTAPLVIGVPGAVYFHCPTRAAAEAMFAAALEGNSVCIIG